MRDAPSICASIMSSLPWLGLTLIDGRPAASLAARAASRTGSAGKSSSVVYWSTAVHNCLSIGVLTPSLLELSDLREISLGPGDRLSVPWRRRRAPMPAQSQPHGHSQSACCLRDSLPGV